MTGFPEGLRSSEPDPTFGYQRRDNFGLGSQLTDGKKRAQEVRGGQLQTIREGLAGEMLRGMLGNGGVTYGSMDRAMEDFGRSLPDMIGE